MASNKLITYIQGKKGEIMRDILAFMNEYLGVAYVKLFLWSIMAISWALFVLIVKKIIK